MARTISETNGLPSTKYKYLTAYLNIYLLLFHFQTQLQVTLSSFSQGYDHIGMFHNYTFDQKADQSFTCLAHYSHPGICIL